jgi:CelD/BcsL family acetyltransferase involved in cellulose biosynthesis
MNLRWVDDRMELRSRAGEWEALLDGSAPEDMFLTFEWCHALRDTWAPGRALPALIGEESGALVVVWPLHIAHRRVARVVPCRALADAGTWFAPHNGIALRPGHSDRIRACLQFLLKAGPDWHVLDVPRLVEGSRAHTALAEACRELGLAVESSPGPSSPYLAIDGSWEDYLAARSSRFRANLKRWERTIRRLGSVELRSCETPAELASAFQLILDIERKSWKQSKGSSITSRPWEQVFYENLLRSAGARGWIRVAFLYLNDAPIAYDLGLVYGGRYASLKTSFVEELRPACPGLFLSRHVLEDLFRRGMSEFDFLGEADPAKLFWTGTVRRHVQLRVYARRPYATALRMLRRLQTRLGRRRLPSAAAKG